jgi:hypothetical protein
LRESGLEAIRRELTVGNNFYLPIDPVMQSEAKEWVAEQEEIIRKAESERISREKLTLKYTPVDLGRCYRRRIGQRHR